jgi:hypothetical protein
MSVASMIRVGGAVAVGMIGTVTLQAKPLTVKECVAEYRSAKAAGFLIKTTWEQFRKAHCPSGPRTLGMEIMSQPQFAHRQR